jgi:outer membrane protein assembly factor BamB
MRRLACVLAASALLALTLQITAIRDDVSGLNQPWGHSEGAVFEPMATTTYPWPMYHFNDTHASLAISPSPDDASVFWFNSTGQTMYGSPAIAEGKVFIGMGDPSGDSMLAFHINNGTRIWKRTTLSQVSGGYGVSSTPAYSNGIVFFAADRIYALYASDGTVKWSVPLPGGNWGGGTVTVAQGKVFVGGPDYKLYAVDELTGTVLWTSTAFSGSPPGGSNFGLYSPPSVWGNYVYIAACDGYVYQFNITQPGSTAAYYHRSARYRVMYGSPTIYNGRIYIGDGYYTDGSGLTRFRALWASDLTESWTFTPPTNGAFFSSASVAYNKVFVGSTNGNLYALDPSNGGLIWNYPTGGAVWSSPAISDGKLFIGSNSNNFYSINANSTNPVTPRWIQPLGGDVVSAPAISDGRVCVGTFGNGGRIYCFGSGMAPPVNNPPTISLTNPSGAQDWTGGVQQLIAWAKGDDTTPANSLKVYLNYTSTPSSGFIGGPITVQTSWLWTAPSIDANDVRINATVIDAEGLKGYSEVLVPQIDSTRPFVQSATPTGTGVALGTPLVVDFSESMKPASVEGVFSLAPNPGGLTYGWSQRSFPNDTLTIRHSAFSGGTIYTADIGTGSSDLSDPGNFLLIDYVWSFTTINTNTPPTISISVPTGGESWTGGTIHSIDWTAADLEDPVGNLRVWVNYSLTGGAPFDHQIGALQGVAGDARPYAWTTPMGDSLSVVLQATVIDTSGADGNGLSPAFEIDSTPPQVSSTSPFSGENGVPTSVNVIATWSEAMNTASAESAFTLKDTATWTTVAGAFSWAGNAMTFNPAAMLLPGAQYSANFTTVALDDSQPGNSLAAPYAWTFTTAMTADTTKPTLMDATAIPDPQEVYLPVNVSAVVQDNVAVGLVRLFVTDPLGGTTNTTMSYDSMAGRYYLERGYGLLGIFTYDVWAADTSGIWNSTSGQFRVVDTTAPSISDLRALPDPVAVFSQTNLSAIVTDNYQLAGVWVEVTAPDLTYTNQSMLPGARYFNNTPANQLGDYAFKVSAVDGRSNWNTASSTFTSVDLVPPVIDHAPAAAWLITSVINITANVTDNVQVQEVWFDFTDTAGMPHNVSMVHSQQDEYFYVVPTQPQVGTLTYHFWAEDQSGNGALSAPFSSLIQRLIPDSPESLTATLEGCNAIRLQWVASTTNDDGSPLTNLAGYNIFRSDVMGTDGILLNTDLVQGTAYLDGNLGSNITYYYTVRAVNSIGIESEHSNEAYAITPATCGSIEPGDNTSPMLLIVIVLAIVIAVIVSIVVVLLVKRRKKERSESEAKSDSVQDAKKNNGKKAK